MNDSIKLAEAMNLAVDSLEIDYGGGPDPEIGYRDFYIEANGKNKWVDEFDPFTDANDCEALIEFLNSKGWQVEVHWQFTDDESLAPGAYVHIWNRFSEVHERSDIDVDRWKECVCKLALKVLE